MQKIEWTKIGGQLEEYKREGKTYLRNKNQKDVQAKAPRYVELKQGLVGELEFVNKPGIS